MWSCIKPTLLIEFLHFSFLQFPKRLFHFVELTQWYCDCIFNLAFLLCQLFLLLYIVNFVYESNSGLPPLTWSNYEFALSTIVSRLIPQLHIYSYSLFLSFIRWFIIIHYIPHIFIPPLKWRLKLSQILFFKAKSAFKCR